MLHDVDLPFFTRLHPLGFPLELRSNSREAIAAAEESWGTQSSVRFETQPIQFRVIVQAEGEQVDTPPVVRAQGHYISVVADRNNFGGCDSQALTGYAFVCEKTVARQHWLRVHFLESITYFLLAQRHAVAMHCACVARKGAGLLLCGASTAGKSTLSFACARAGWTFVSDDATWLAVEGGGRTAMGTARRARFRPNAPQLFPELDGYEARLHPNGKIAMEVPLSDFPEIQTASRCEIEGLVLLDRSGNRGVRRTRMATEDVLDGILADIPSYGAEVRAMCERTVGRLARLPAWRLEYAAVDDALALLDEIHPS